MSDLRDRKGPRTILGLLAALGLVAALAMPVLAGVEGPLVDPIFHEETANQTCADLLGGWSEENGEFEFKPAGGGVPSNDDYSDGTLDVTISGMTGDSFNWSSNIGVDAVYVKGGNGGSNLYWYDTDGGPGEVTGDNNLVVPNADNNGISHVTFCYDTNDAPPSEAPESEAPPSEPAESEPAESPPGEESEEPEESIREGELGGTPTPAPSAGELPDTAFGDFGTTPATVLSLVLIAALAGMVYVRLARQR